MGDNLGSEATVQGGYVGHVDVVKSWQRKHLNQRQKGRAAVDVVAQKESANRFDRLELLYSTLFGLGPISFDQKKFFVTSVTSGLIGNKLVIRRI